MPLEVILPRVDMDMATGKISKWYVREGDAVKKGVPIFEIETDKAAMEVESPGDGIIRHIAASEGIDIPVGTAVAFLYAEGEAVAGPRVEPAGLKAVAAHAAELERATAAIGRQEPRETPQSGLPRATPLTRRLAREGGLDLSAVTGSGPRGRIQAEDVRNAALPERPEPRTSIGGDAVASLYQPGSYDILPINGMRRTIAQRLVHSKQTVPHFYLSLTCDLGRLMEVREMLNAGAPRNKDKTPAWKLSVNDFVIKALAMALQKVPAANATWAEDRILRHRTSDVGVAVAVEGGLFTPIVRAAETKPLSAISGEMKDLATRARARQLAPAEYQGGTAAVSNLGMFGIEAFTAIINPPHATILAVGAGVERPAGWKGQMMLRTQMTCTLSCDHRIVDGAVGAELLAAFRMFVEEPALMLV